jgi:serine/threonine protein kinase
MANTPQDPKHHEQDDDPTIIRPERGAGVVDKAAKFSSRLTLLKLIGQGGVGRVHLAYDESIGRRVAVKELLEEYVQATQGNQAIVNSFLHEAKLTGKLEHPGVVPIYALGKRADGRPYYVMRYVKGETMEQALKKCSASDTESAFARRLKLLDSLIAACNTMAYAHSKGVIHRDIKPANIINGGFGETIVLDWGLAQALEEDDNTYFYREVLTHQRHTFSDHTTSEVLGTPAYMAPEQFNGIASKASDVYSLGVILYRILTGELPYRGRLADIQKQIEAASASPSAKKINPAAQPELIAICDKAMRKQAEQRFADAGELAAELKAFRSGRMVNIYAYSKKELLRRFLLQNKTMLIMAAILLLSIVGGAGFSLHYAKQMEHAKSEAEGALVVLTSFGERSQTQARAIARNISSSIGHLFDDLAQAAAEVDFNDEQSSQALLTKLQARYPKFEAFNLRNAADIPTSFGKDADEYSQNVQRPIAKFENKRLVLIFRVPVIRNGDTLAYLETRMYPEKVLPDFLPLNTESDTHKRNIWIMRYDGLIVFDETPQYIATNLFVDSLNYRSPSLQAFGRMMLTDDDSIGYYSVIDGQSEIYKIAAWDSVNFGSGQSWKVVVSYVYLTKKPLLSPSVSDLLDW